MQVWQFRNILIIRSTYDLERYTRTYVYEGKNIDSNKRSIAYSLTFGTPDRNLNDEEINSILDNIIKDLENKGLEIRKGI